MFRCLHVPAPRRKSNRSQTRRNDGPDRGECGLLDAAARFRHGSEPGGELVLLRPDPGRPVRQRTPGRNHPRIRNPSMRARRRCQSVHPAHVDVHARRLVPHSWEHVVFVGLRRQRRRRDGPVSFRRLLRAMRPRGSIRADRYGPVESGADGRSVRRHRRRHGRIRPALSPRARAHVRYSSAST